MCNKSKYIIKNWRDYNKPLEARGRINFWFSEEAIMPWTNHNLSGKRGASDYYSDIAIESFLMVKSIYHLPLRQTKGFIMSLFELMRLELDVPDFSTVSRRRKKLKCSLPEKPRSEKWYLDEPVHVVVDSTGVKIYGEGEWKVKIHQAGKRRTWRKLHLAVNEANGEILAAKVTGAEVTDGEVFEPLLEEIKVPIKKVSADGAYDKKKVYEYLRSKRVKALIPPREDARLWRDEPNWIRYDRNENIVRIAIDGKQHWKLNSGYSRRSLAETTMFRYKRTFGERIDSRLFQSQVNDLIIRCKMLNKMFEAGKPVSVKIR